MLKVTEMLTKYNHDKASGRKIKYLVIHWVGAASTAVNNGTYFQGGDRGASAHYFVNDTHIVKSVRERDIAWAVGRHGLLDQGSPNAKYGGSLFGKCTNQNTVSIEMGCKKNAKGKLYITEKTIKNTADLVQAIQKRLGIDDDHVIRHFDVNGKLCPYPDIEPSKWKVLHAKLTGQHQKIRAKGNLIVRKSSLLTSKRIGLLTKGKSYEIVKTNKKKSRGQLADGGWITITEKYAEKL